MPIHSALMSSQPAIAPPHEPQLNLAPADLRILIVNEDMRSADWLKCTLRELGYTTTLTAYSARRALVAMPPAFFNADTRPSALRNAAFTRAVEVPPITSWQSRVASSDTAG